METLYKVWRRTVEVTVFLLVLLALAYGVCLTLDQVVYRSAWRTQTRVGCLTPVPDTSAADPIPPSGCGSIT